MLNLRKFHVEDKIKIKTVFLYLFLALTSNSRKKISSTFVVDKQIFVVIVHKYNLMNSLFWKQTQIVTLNKQKLTVTSL